MDTDTQNGHHPDGTVLDPPKPRGGRPPKAPDLTLDEAKALYDAAKKATAKARLAEEKAADELAEASATHIRKKTTHVEKDADLKACQAAEETAREAYRKAQARTIS